MKSKQMFGWAVLDGDALALIDYRLPLFWLKRLAVKFNQERLNGTGRVVKMRVTPHAR